MDNSFKTSVTDPEVMDQSIKATDDFYRHANGTWLRDHKIPGDRPADGAFLNLRDEAEKNVRAIVDDLNPESESEEERKLARLYAQFIDEDGAEQRGFAPLLPDFQLIDAATTHDELAVAIGDLQATGVSGLVELFVDADMNAPEQYTAMTYQGGLELPDEAYYRDDKYADMRTAYVDYLNGARQILAKDEQFSNWADKVGETFGEDVLAYETTIASKHWDNVATRDSVKSNNPTTLKELVEKYEGFPWADWWGAAGFPNREDTDVNVRQPSFLEAVPSLWNDTDLETLKKWAYAHVIAARSPFLTKELVDNNFAFARIFSGVTEQRARWKRGISFLEGTMGEALGKLYVKRYFPPEYKQQMTDLVANLIEAYRRSISDLDWMSEETRERALEKLSQFTPKVGYPDEWKDYSKLEVGSDLVESVRASARFHTAREADKLSGPVDQNEWHMTPQTVNAYYHPTMNEIVFPAAILQSPFFNPEESDAVNYGAIGAVIGHEIGHGFDDQGSLYDGTGRLNNWWTEEDREAFEQRTASLIGQYDEFSPEQLDDSYKVNGKLTIGENIGDLGGLGIAWKAYKIALEQKGIASPLEDEKDGLSGAQQFFYSWARIWRQKSRDEYAIRLLAIDPHSPTEFRCNGVLRNMDAFHETFGTKPGDGMWLDEDKRVVIW
ncbi:MAG: M13-type metalloendopeptidase [Actinomycetaceae bacterium]|nr:M13-type metalloendopeptidase [Actinomycetaceae bacterium]